MSLVFAAITPHPPLLLESIGKDASKQLAKTAQAFKQLEQELYAAQPDVIVIVSPHGSILPDSFILNLSSQYRVDFSEFGDFSDQKTFKPHIPFIEMLRSELRQQTAITVTSEEVLDHGVAVPLLFLTENLKQTAIVPISHCLLDYPAHLKFGQALREEIMSTNTRVAVIASGDLSHRLSKNSPAGHHPQAEAFDAAVQEKIRAKDIDGLFKLDPQLIEDAQECGLRSFAVLFGVLDELNYQPQLLSYEAPFGVGYLTVNFVLH